MTIQYSDSAYRFTDPIRLYKANDPYYFEVDNIPLKQLQENCNWLKDQLSALAGGDFTGGLKRQSFDELRPYANGDDRVIRVKPGRYTARINDASYSDPLALLEQIGNTNNDEQGFTGGDEWRSRVLGVNETSSDPTSLYAALEKFKSTLAADSLGCDGLIGRCWTWPTYSEVDAAGAGGGGAAVDLIDFPFHPGASIGYSSAKLQRLIFPILRVAGWKYRDEPGSFDFLFGGWFDDFYGYTQLPFAEMVLLKKWRGIARTAVVNVEDEISVEVPPFDPADFSYRDSDGVLQSVDGVQSRIDLVFIYSKPVDRERAGKINTYNPPEYITKPQLGIVQGAGIRLNQSQAGEVGNGNENTRFEVATDNHKMLASPGDQFNDSLGFTATSANDITYDVRGSFPAPDDILNLAPLISEKLSENAYELVGQSILPVAYVWVRGTSEGVQQTVLSTDVIDIRPFFRTTELAYNERVGIAAAMPQLSIANPAVGKAQLDRTAQNLKSYIDSRVSEDTTPEGGTQKVLATGYVFGGWAFGPEGAIFNHYSRQQPGATAPEIRDLVAQKYGFGSLDNPITIPYFPQWDANTVIRTGNTSLYTNQSAYDGGNFGGASDALSKYLKTYINIFVSQAGSISTFGSDNTIAGASFAGKIAQATPPNFGISYPLYDQDVNDNFKNSDAFNATFSRVKFCYVRKKIKFSRPANMLDYHVNLDFVNCLPQTHSGANGNLETQGAYTGMWVEKGYDYFTIYSAFSVNSARPTTQAALDDLVDDGKYGGFAVMVQDIEVSNPTAINAGYTGNPRVGKCGLPTVMWSITGISNNGANYFYPNLNGFEPTISLDTL